MNLNSYNKWKDGVISHYGEVEKFDHAPTIRIMRNGLNEQLTEYLKWVDEAKTEEIATILRECFQEDAKIAAKEIFMLDSWLKKRGLEL